jgi:hypothetical protein
MVSATAKGETEEMMTALRPWPFVTHAEAFVTFVSVPVTCGKLGGPFGTFCHFISGAYPLLVEDGGYPVANSYSRVANSYSPFPKRYTAKIK